MDLLGWLSQTAVAGGGVLGLAMTAIYLMVREQSRRDQEQNTTILMIMLHLGDIRPITKADVVEYILKGQHQPSGVLLDLVGKVI